MKIDERLKAILVEQLGVSDEEVTETAALMDDLGADSIDLIEIALQVEEEFDVEVVDDAMSAQHTVADLTRYVKSLARAA